MAYLTVDSSQQLADLCEKARQQGRIGIDTEFLWERTYAPQICLVQFAVGECVAIADPLEGIDVQPVADLVADPAVEVVMHAPHADLVGFLRHHGAEPTRVFDTQIAAGFVGLSAGLSYERLVSETIGRKLQPSESFSDWSRRPLTKKQLRYAAEDVEHLFEVADWIRQRLHEMGRLEWAEEEMQRRFGTPARLATPPLEAWRKVARRGRLQGRDLCVLQHVAAWRERNARERDVPASWVMKDASLVEVAKRKPREQVELLKIRGIDGSIRRSDMADLIDAVREGMGAPRPEEPAAAQPRAVRKRVAIAKGLTTALMRARCESADIAPELVGTSQDVEDLIAWVAEHGAPADSADVDETQLPALLRGWRAEFGNDLVDLIEGRLQLALSQREPYLMVQRSEQRV